MQEMQCESRLAPDAALRRCEVVNDVEQRERVVTVARSKQVDRQHARLALGSEAQVCSGLLSGEEIAQRRKQVDIGVLRSGDRAPRTRVDLQEMVVPVGRA